MKKYGGAGLKFVQWIGADLGVKSWIQALNGKKVLVISPFEKSIIAQHSVFEKVWKGYEKIPRFQLSTIKAVQSVRGMHPEGLDSWEQSLSYMFEQAMDKEFDVALIGAGAYSLPLGSMIKKVGKVAIHMGGDLQLLFGISGRRWDNNIIIK
ncbi:MAG: hypothetical protein K6F35_09550 [Lachnospiraceae bacterium]|nr:hypothetical protein [Lachnospiraceae bacterium]